MSEELKKVSVFLIKKEIVNINDIIKFKDDNPKRIELVPEVEVEDGAFYLGKTSQKEPEWLGFLNQLSIEKQELDLNTTNSAVLVLKPKAINRFFAFCFGYGRFLINMNNIERQFGLKVALNIINPSKLRTMDYKKYEEVVINTKRQVSRGSALRVFDIDINSELLRNIGGKVKENEEIGISVYGSDSVVLNLKKSVGKNNIVGLCTQLIDLYSSSGYKEYFDFIDHLKPVDEPGKIEDLDNQLLDVINEKRLADFHMAPPEIFDYEDCEGFSFSTLPQTNEPKYDLEKEDYCNSFGKLDNINKLKEHQVRVKSSSNDVWVDRWPVYNCIVFETKKDDENYVFHEGSWFHVERNFYEQLNSEIEDIAKNTEITLPLVPADLDPEVVVRFSDEETDKLKPTHEKYFNEYVGCKSDDKVTLDRRAIYPSYARTPIEFCDIITTKGQLIHVKPGTSSSDLSHLFKQGSVSAELFVSDSKLRKEVIKILEDDPRWSYWPPTEMQRDKNLQKRKDLVQLISENIDNVDRNKFEVVYCIITNIPDTQWPSKIPFFSKVSLRKEKRTIEKLGLRVSLIKV